MQQQIESKADWAFNTNPATDNEIRAMLSAELPDLHRNAIFLITYMLRKLLTQNTHGGLETCIVRRGLFSILL